jgi:nickel transport protein
MRHVLLVGLLCLLPRAALAHEVLHQIERGRAVAVKAYFADGEVMAYTEYQVFSPADAKIPYQKGRSDRGGYVAFVPDVPGTWHVRIVDPSGHGLELDVPVPAAGQGGSNPPAPGGRIATWAFVARPLVGVAAIALLFGLVVWLYRRKAAGR